MADPSKHPEKEVDRFDDVFHSHGDDIDESEDANVDFDQFFTDFRKNDDDNVEVQIDPIKDDENIAIHLTTEEQHLSQKLSKTSASGKEQNDDKDENEDANIDFDQFFTDFSKNDDDNAELKIDPIKGDDNIAIDLITEEQHLSQKLTEATINKRPSLTPSTPVTTTKKLKTDKKEQSSDEMPKYLSHTNNAFERVMNPLLEKTGNTINIEDLRQIALLIHKLTLIDLNRTLWTTYLCSGTGRLTHQEQLQEETTTTISTHPNLTIWPQEVLSTIIPKDRTTVTNPNEIDHDSCLNCVYRVLRKFREESAHYQTQLKERKQCLNNSFTLEMEESIKNFLEKYGIDLHRIPIESKIAIVKYDYNDRLIELEFYQENPYQYQVDVFKNLSQGKLDKEVAQTEVAILKQRIVHNHLPSIVDSLRIPLPISLDTIDDEHIRQRLTYRYEQLLQRTKSELMIIYIKTAEAKSTEFQKKFDIYMIQYKENQRSGPTHKKLTPQMVAIMERRFKNINERLICLYKLKKRFFVKAPTVMN